MSLVVVPWKPATAKAWQPASSRRRTESGVSLPQSSGAWDGIGGIEGAVVTVDRAFDRGAGVRGAVVLTRPAVGGAAAGSLLLPDVCLIIAPTPDGP
jgi:hypothetical protein